MIHTSPLFRIDLNSGHKAELAVFPMPSAAGVSVYNEMCKRLRADAHPEAPEPADANDPIWILIVSAHGAQPQIELKNGEMPKTGVTRQQALQDALKFSNEWDNLCGGVANVIRLSDISPQTVELWAKR